MPSINPDIQKERDSATFDVEDLSNLINGGKEKRAKYKQISDLLYNDPNLFKIDTVHLSPGEKYTEAVRKGAYGIKLAEENKDIIKTREDFIQLCQLVGEGNPNPLHNLQNGMYIPTIMKQGTEEQKKKWLQPALDYRAIGTYAQTELGHGTFLRGLETTATYDPSTQEFVLNSPTISSYKWWPGTLAKTSNHAVVMAQLYTKGECHGVHAFIVNVRSEKDHTTLPGITLGDIGPKFSYNEVDNGFMKFDNFRIPRENMLMRYSQVKPDGTYVKPVRDKIAYGTMTLVRVQIVRAAAWSLGKACTIAIRYSAVRRQSEMRPGEPEPQILSYSTQQHKLFPLLAHAYAFVFTEVEMLRMYKVVTAEVNKGNFANSQELHALSSGLKSYTTTITADGIEVCRLACGGHGYSMASGLPQLYSHFTANCTYEGENTVLLLQTGRYLMKCCKESENGKPLPMFANYLANKPTRQENSSLSDFSHLISMYQSRAYNQVHFAFSLLKKAESSGMDWVGALNHVSIHLLRATNAHLHYYILKTFMDGVANSTMQNETRKVMHDLIQLFAIEGISKNGGEFLESDALSVKEVQQAHHQVVHLLAKIRPNAVTLVDAFEIRDELLHSVLGRYDGNVYPNMVKWAMQSPLNKTDVHPAYAKHIKPLLRRKSKL